MTTHTIGTREEWPAAVALGAADWVCLAAAPTFAIMALLTGVLGGGPQDMFCSAAQDALPLNGMVWMYMLMSAFHSGPWLKLISSRRAAPAGRDPCVRQSRAQIHRLTGLRGRTWSAPRDKLLDRQEAGDAEQSRFARGMAQGAP